MPRAKNTIPSSRKLRADYARRTGDVKASASKKAETAATKLCPADKTATNSKYLLGVACLLAGVWSYGSTLIQLARTWNNEPDYSHGFLVLPVAVMFLWLRRGSFPGMNSTSPMVGVGLLGVSLAMRFLGAKYFLTFMDGWSVLPWVASVVVVIGGWPLLQWSLPSIGFLFFMIPLPFRIEGELSAPLQKIATKLSTTALQILGQPAFSEGNVITLGSERLEVAQACSGLRLFVSVLALAYAYIAAIQRPWWEKLVLAMSAIPIAILANSARIVMTGLIYQTTTSEWARQVAHDTAGWGMILVAAAMFGMLLWYLKRLVYEDEIVDMASLVRDSSLNPGRN